MININIFLLIYLLANSIVCMRIFYVSGIKDARNNMFTWFLVWLIGMLFGVIISVALIIFSKIKRSKK